MPKNIGYIRVPTVKQDLENQKHQILNYANIKKLEAVEFIEIQVSSRKSEEDRKINLFYSHRIPHSIRGYMLNNIYSKHKNFITVFNDNFKNIDINDKNYIHWHQSGRRHNIEFYNNFIFIGF